MNLKYKSFGARGDTCQIMRIEQGLRDIGLEESNTPNFVYSNDAGSHMEAINFANQYGGELILNVLDIPTHINNFDYQRLYNTIKCAKKITTISEFVQKQIKDIFELDGEVIYQPIMNVYKDDRILKFPYKYMHVGRRYDANKNFMLAMQALDTMKIEDSDVILVGPEIVQFGTSVGLVSEKTLNALYNSVDFVFSLGKIEGLSLTVIETMAAGAIPIVHNQLSTINELLPKDIFPEYYEINPDFQDIVKFLKRFDDAQYKKEFKERIFRFYNEKLAMKFTSVGVAIAIKEVYEKKVS